MDMCEFYYLHTFPVIHSLLHTRIHIREIYYENLYESWTAAGRQQNGNRKVLNIYFLYS